MSVSSAMDKKVNQNLGITDRYDDPIYIAWAKYMGVFGLGREAEFYKPIGQRYEFTIGSLYMASYLKDMMPDEWLKFKALHRMGVLGDRMD